MERTVIYADSGVIMRLIEGAPRARLPIEARLQQLPVEQRSFITSRLSMLECRCKPLREEDVETLALYDHFFSSDDVAIREIDDEVVEKATVFRAHLGLKVSDALHAATATAHKATSFWTTDRGFVKCADLAVELFPAV